MKKVFAMVMAVVMVLGSQAFVFAGTSVGTARDLSVENGYAQQLKDLGLFKGVSDTDFDLNRAPSRVEAMVMLIRLLGAEETAQSGTYTHPFTDVPSWANSYIGYAYENGLTKGISATKFGTGNANAQMYLTYVLRALGYSDAEGQDFTYDNPYTLAESCNILPGSVDTKSFLRADAVTVSHASMNAALKGDKLTLAEALIDKGVFTEENYSESYYGTILNTFTSEKIDEGNHGTYKITVLGPIIDDATYVAGYGGMGGYNYAKLTGAELKQNNNMLIIKTGGGYLPSTPKILLRMFPAGVDWEEFDIYADWSYGVIPGEVGFFDGSLNKTLKNLEKDFRGLKPGEVKTLRGDGKISVDYEGDRTFRVHLTDFSVDAEDICKVYFDMRFSDMGCGYGGEKGGHYFTLDNGDLMIDFSNLYGPSEEDKDKYTEALKYETFQYEYYIELTNKARFIYTGTYKLEN